LAGAAVAQHAAVGGEHATAGAAAGLAAEQAVDRVVDALRVDRDEHLQTILVALAEANDLAEAAAHLAGTAAVSAECLLQHQYWNAAFHQLDGGVGSRGRPQQRGVAVAAL